MLVISVDPFEFENASSEESLEIAVEARGKRPFSTVEDFVASRVGIEASRRLPTPVSFQHMHGLGQVIALRHPRDCGPAEMEARTGSGVFRQAKNFIRQNDAYN
jgi:hypothetical protein